MSSILEMLKNLISGLYFPRIGLSDVVEILILAALIYVIMVWIQRTRAYTLLRGMITVVVFLTLVRLFQLSAIWWIAQNLASIALLALVIIFQPELRKGLESLGNRSFFSMLVPFDSQHQERFTENTINEIVRAVNDMSEVRTGALIVIEQQILLTEFISTGIELDARMSSQLLTNIFEHNTPLHDGAVVVRGDRIVAATCYLPLSENVSISKKFGTRHRAGLGISEVSDAFTIIVSEETGRVSYSYMGVLNTGVTASDLREQLHNVQRNTMNDRNESKFRIWKGRDSNEE